MYLDICYRGSYNQSFLDIKWGSDGGRLVAKPCWTLCNPMDYKVHGILQVRILKWVAFPFSRGSSQPRGRTQVSHIAGRFITSRATKETQEYWSG